MKKLIIILFNVLILNSALATTYQHYIIIDAGSSGSRLHFFKYSNNKNMPIIEEIFTTKSTTPLAAFAETPEKAYESLNPMLVQAEKVIHDHAIPKPVPTAILGTAGMRLLASDQQKAIYDNLKLNLLENHKNTLAPKNINTISGKMEGLYGWLDVNYLLKNFQNNAPTVGSIDIGGASTEIAYAIEKSNKSINETAFTINNTNYVVFSKSFLGLGMDEARGSMDIDPNAITCYPKGYFATEKNNFDLPQCSNIYNQIIDNYQIKKSGMPTYKIPTFVVFGGAYYTYHFFGQGPTIPNQDTLEQTIIKPLCNNTWEALKQAYPAEPEIYLVAYCANSVFVTNLLFDAFQLQPQQMNIASAIDENKIDWALGAMLYTTIKDNAS